jgi:hypothetical protein
MTRLTTAQITQSYTAEINKVCIAKRHRCSGGILLLRNRGLRQTKLIFGRRFMRHVHDDFHRFVVPRDDNADVGDLHSGVHSPLRRPHAIGATAHYDWTAVSAIRIFRLVE